MTVEEGGLIDKDISNRSQQQYLSQSDGVKSQAQAAKLW
jgi:hypothetical protein